MLLLYITKKETFKHVNAWLEDVKNSEDSPTRNRKNVGKKPMKKDRYYLIILQKQKRILILYDGEFKRNS